MNDMSQVIIPKSDQINAEDFLSGPLTFTITGVQIKMGQEQPVSMALEGTRKVFRPCKGVCRLIVAIWGADANEYVGRSLTLFRDPDVTWAGMKVGGIRILRMSHLDDAITMAVTERKGSKKAYLIEPLTIEHQQSEETPLDNARAALEEAATLEALATVWKHRKMAPFRAELQSVLDARKAALTPVDTVTPDNPAAGEGRDDSDYGEPHTDPTPRLIALFNEAETPADVDAAMAEFRAAISDLDSDGATQVEDAAKTARARVAK